MVPRWDITLGDTKIIRFSNFDLRIFWSIYLAKNHPESRVYPPEDLCQALSHLIYLAAENFGLMSLLSPSVISKIYLKRLPTHFESQILQLPSFAWKKKQLSQCMLAIVRGSLESPCIAVCILYNCTYHKRITYDLYETNQK